MAILGVIEHRYSKSASIGNSISHSITRTAAARARSSLLVDRCASAVALPAADARTVAQATLRGPVVSCAEKPATRGVS